MTIVAEPIPERLADHLAGSRGGGLWRDTLRNILRQRSAAVGLGILATLLLVAVLADQIAPYAPIAQVAGAERHADPCIHLLGCPEAQPQVLLGTDANFRDVFSRVVHGARISLQVGFLTVGFAIVIGTLVGAVSGFAGGWLDNVVMRLMDVLLAFPALVLAIGIVSIPVYARVMRASVISIREREFVVASRALGESAPGILFRKILPNALTPLIVQGTLGIAGAVLEVAALSFLGMGAQPPLAEWGSMIGLERNSIFNAPYVILAPGIALALTVLGFNLLGDGLRDGRGLRTSFHTRDGIVRAVDGVDFHVDRGEVMGLVGESGCGKSVTSLSILRLIAAPGRIDGGQVLFDGHDLLTLGPREIRAIRGNRIAMIFQQPQSSLNPVYTAGLQIAEALEIHRSMKRRAARERALELMRMVGISDPRRRLDAFPHELSGGMAQRVMIAMALACEPELLIADEPTTALDVTIQAQILDLMRTLQRETGTSIILITHDLGVVAEMCDRVAVMYAGEIVEQADAISLFREPKHPYTQGLIASIPVLGEERDSLAVIPGNVPNLVDLPPACRFAPRCRVRVERNVPYTTELHPALLPVEPGHEVRCWQYHSPEQAQSR